MIESSAARGMKKQENAQNDQRKAQNHSVESRVNDQREEIVSEKKIRASSRESRKPAWMIDYI